MYSRGITRTAWLLKQNISYQQLRFLTKRRSIRDSSCISLSRTGKPQSVVLGSRNHNQENQQQRCSRKVPAYNSLATSHHASTFPWLLSAEKQRVPNDDFVATAPDSGQTQTTSGIARFLPKIISDQIANLLNGYIAQRAIGSHALDDVVSGAKLALPRITHVLSKAPESPDLARMFSKSLYERFNSELHGLADDNVALSLEVSKVNSAVIHRIRTQVGPPEAFEPCQSHPLDNSSLAYPSLRMGVVRHTYKVNRAFGVLHAKVSDALDSANETTPSAAALLGRVFDDVFGQKAPIRLYVDVELNINMRYQLMHKHIPHSASAINLADTPRSIVDDNARRNLMLTLKSSPVYASTEGSTPHALKWAVADIDYLLSSEQRFYNELH